MAADHGAYTALPTLVARLLVRCRVSLPDGFPITALSRRPANHIEDDTGLQPCRCYLLVRVEESNLAFSARSQERSYPRTNASEASRSRTPLLLLKAGNIHAKN